MKGCELGVRGFVGRQAEATDPGVEALVAWWGQGLGSGVKG